MPPAATVRAKSLPVLRGGRLRAVVRVIGAVVWSASLTLIWAVVNLLLLPVPRARVRWRHRVVGTWAQGVAWLIGMRRRVIGTPPKAPFFLASNHLSYIDIILLYTCVDGVFIAKREMRHWPVLGPLANLFGTIWVNRQVRRDAVRVLDEIDEAVARGDGVVLFAEGTSSSGDGLLPMHPALFDWAAREQYPVHCASLTYRTRSDSPPARMVLCWWGEMPFGPHLMNLIRLPGFEATVEFAPAAVTAPTRGEVAQRVQAEIARRFVPIRKPEETGP